MTLTEGQGHKVTIVKNIKEKISQEPSQLLGWNLVHIVYDSGYIDAYQIWWRHFRLWEIIAVWTWLLSQNHGAWATFEYLWHTSQKFYAKVRDSVNMLPNYSNSDLDLRSRSPRSLSFWNIRMTLSQEQCQLPGWNFVPIIYDSGIIHVCHSWLRHFRVGEIITIWTW